MRELDETFLVLAIVAPISAFILGIIISLTHAPSYFAYVGTVVCLGITWIICNPTCYPSSVYFCQSTRQPSAISRF
jgi:hypothetical protein